MKLVRRKVSVVVPEVLARPIAPYEDEEAAFKDRADALLEWASTSEHSFAPEDPWKHAALFLADQVLPGMQLGKPKRAGRKRTRPGLTGGPRTSLNRDEGEWLVGAIDRFVQKAKAHGEPSSVKDAADHLKIGRATKERVSAWEASTLRQEYFRQKKRQRIELARRELEASARKG